MEDARHDEQDTDEEKGNAASDVDFVQSKDDQRSADESGKKRRDDQERRKPVIGTRGAHVGEVVGKVSDDLYDLDPIKKYDRKERSKVKPDSIVDGLRKGDISVEEFYHNERDHRLAAYGEPLRDALYNPEDDCL